MKSLAHNLTLQASLVITLSLAVHSYAADYWVSKTGSDSNDCSSEANACLNINTAMTLATTPEDIVNIKPGVYRETASQYVWRINDTSIAFHTSGTKDNLITLQAASGHEGSVTIDGQGVRNGIGVMVAIRSLEIFNVSLAGIIAVSTTGKYVDFDINNASQLDTMIRGVVAENNYIHHVDALQAGENPGGIQAHGCYQWIIRNNRIDDVRILGDQNNGNAAGINSYVLIDTLIENNDISGTYAAVKFKKQTEGNWAKNILRYNISHDLTHAGIFFNDSGGIKGNTHPIDKFDITHNIFHSVPAGVALWYSGNAGVLIKNNTFDVTGEAINVAAEEGIEQIGKIINAPLDYLTPHSSGVIKNPDQNIFVESLTIELGRNDTVAFYTTLSSWQSAIHPSLSTSNPDANSAIYPLAGLFTDHANHDYTLPAGSPALGFMSDGSNSGAYQTGSETIGLLTSNTATPPAPPSSLQIQRQ